MEMISVGLWVAKLFGKTPAAAAARRIGGVVCGLGALIALGLLVFIGIRIHDHGVAQAALDQKDAQVAREAEKARSAAEAESVVQARQAAVENKDLQDAVNAAKAKHPADEVPRVVGDVQQSYFDHLPKQRKH